MGGVFLYATVIFFLSFGIIAFINFITDFVYESKYLKNKTVYTVVPVENEACSIENVVKAINFKAEKSYSGVYDNRIIFVDNGSSDATYKMLKRLEKTYSEISVANKEDIHKKLDFFH